MKMQTDSCIEVVSPDHYYAYSRHTERTFCSYESPCQTRINPVLSASLLHHNTLAIVDHTAYDRTRVSGPDRIRELDSSSTET